MTEFGTRKQALESRIAELEDTLAHLKEQLKTEEEAEQHDAIDKLEIYLDELNDRNANLQAFWKVLREEIRDIFSAPSKSKES